MDLKSSACDAWSLGMLHMDVDCQDLGFLYSIYLPKIQEMTIILLGTHHCGSTILVVAQGMCGAKKIWSWKESIRFGLEFLLMDLFNYNSLF